jgi:hypothetical protein
VSRPGTVEVHHVCPYCLAEHSFATGVGDAPPDLTPGSVSFCIHCGRFSLFDDRMQLREPHPSELSLILADKKAWAVFEAWVVRRAARRVDR